MSSSFHGCPFFHENTCQWTPTQPCTFCLSIKRLNVRLCVHLFRVRSLQSCDTDKAAVVRCCFSMTFTQCQYCHAHEFPFVANPLRKRRRSAPSGCLARFFLEPLSAAQISSRQAIFQAKRDEVGTASWSRLSSLSLSCRTPPPPDLETSPDPPNPDMK